MITKLPADEQKRRNKAIQESKADAMEEGSLRYGVMWLKRRGATREKVLDLADWAPREREVIGKIFANFYL